MNVAAERIAEVRAFNRFYTRIVGALDEGLVGTPHTLSEARVLYELAQHRVREVPDLRARLGLDPGYASRLLARLDERGLLTRARSETDSRRQTVALTDAGRAAQDELEEHTNGRLGDLLGALTDEDQRRLLAAMDTIAGLLGDHRREAALVLRPPRAGDYGWIVQRNGALYAEEYGWDASYEALVARIVADYVGERGTKACWIAELDGERVGCVCCVPGSDADTAKLRLLVVEPSARGAGVGTRLVAECMAFARSAGYRRMELWTQSVLTAARAIYAKAGFELAATEQHHSFGHDLVAETWTRRL